MKTRRTAFTLVEILVVIAIIVLLLGLVLAFYPKREVRYAADGASNLQSYLAGAKARALRDRQPVGIRFISEDNGETFTSAQLVTTPEVFAPINPGTQPFTIYLDFPSGSTIQANNQNSGQIVWNTVRQVGVPLQGNVEVGDFLEIVEVTPSIHKIVAIDYASNTINLASRKELIEKNGNGIYEPALGEYWHVHGIPNINCTASAQLPWNYRYIRGPRPLMGEQPFQLPRDVVIRGATGIVPSSLNVPMDNKGNYEIRFSPSGEVLNASGRIVLWIEDTNRVAKPTLLCIYPSGSIAAHDVGPAGNEYVYTQDGK